MAKSRPVNETPLYGLDSFSVKASESSFYIETLQVHLENHKFISKPHRHNFYLLLYITGGSGEHTIDFKTYPITPGSFFLMTPGQVHSWNLKQDTDGFIIFFTQGFYRLRLNESSLMEFPFFNSLHAIPCIHLQPDHTIDVVIKEMQVEFKNPKSTIDLRILRSYLDLLLLKLARVYPLNKDDEAVNTNASKLRKLELLIDKHFVKLKGPSEYSDLMNLSPSYLNTICKQSLGKTLSELIIERVVLEAKRYFAHSDLTVSQVSNKLNFSSASYFIRFFKKHTGFTPEQFKQSMNNGIQ